MTTASFSCHTASGKTLEELSRLIALRAQRMGELTSDAVIATAIDCLNSLRTETRDARDGDGRYPPRRLYHCADLYPSYSHSTNPPIPCARRGSPRGPRLHEPIAFASKGMDLKNAKVYRVTPVHEADSPYYIFTYSPEDVLKFELARIRRAIAWMGGLAKTALGLAMAKISTRPPQIDAKQHARNIASKLSICTVNVAGWASGKAFVEYRDLLNYAIPALKSGESGVNAALMRAANKIAGLITHTLHNQGDFEHDVATPFPEVKRTR